MTQKSSLVMYLANNKGKGITQLEATNLLGILRLSERIRELQDAGYTIRKRRVTVQSRYRDKVSVVRYWLA